MSTSAKPAPQQIGGGEGEANPAVAAAPLLVFEDRGALTNAAGAPREADDAPQGPAPASGAPQRAAQDAAQNGLAAPAPQPLSQAGVLPATNVPGGLPPLSRLHEEVAAFATAAWPTRVSFKKSIFFPRVFFSTFSAFDSRPLLAFFPLPSDSRPLTASNPSTTSLSTPIHS